LASVNAAEIAEMSLLAFFTTFVGYGAGSGGRAGKETEDEVILAAVQVEVLSESKDNRQSTLRRQWRRIGRARRIVKVLRGGEGGCF